MEQRNEAIASLEGHFYVSLTTFRRDGRGVATPVYFVAHEDRFYFRTRVRTGKVRRIRATGRVMFAASDREGRRTGPTFTGRARLLDEDERKGAKIVAKLNGKYGMTGRLFNLSFLLPGRRGAFVEVTGEPRFPREPPS